MATSVDYAGIGKSLIIDNDTFFTFYGQDSDPNIPPRPSTFNSISTSGETSYDLSGFQVGNQVCCCYLVIYHRDIGEVHLSSNIYLEKSYDGSTYYYTGWEDIGEYDLIGYSGKMYLFSIGVDSDEIWIGETYYRFHIEWSCTDGSSGTINLPFRVYNLSFDDSLHNSGYFRVEGNYLCYTDGTRGNRGFKHKINYDTGYNGGSGHPGYVWIPSSNDNHIYYTASNGTVRRTHISSSWYGYYGDNYAPLGAKPGMIWVSNGDYTKGYGYLCYVNSQGQLRRMGNGQP